MLVGRPAPVSGTGQALRLRSATLRVNGTAAVRPERSPGGAKSKDAQSRPRSYPSSVLRFVRRMADPSETPISTTE